MAAPIHLLSGEVMEFIATKYTREVGVSVGAARLEGEDPFTPAFTQASSFVRGQRSTHRWDIHPSSTSFSLVYETHTHASPRGQPARQPARQPGRSLPPASSYRAPSSSGMARTRMSW
jgi:hypothetical protein